MRVGTAHHAPQAPDDSTTGRHLPALDGVRGVAILLVLLRHLFVRNPFADGSAPVRIVTRLLATGWVGVDLFFVLSGFLITGILFDTQATPHFFRNFYARRALRIFPLYYGVIGLLMLVSVPMGYHWFAPGTARLLTYSNTLFLQGIGATDAPAVNLNQMWSLQIEEQFYLVWPLTVLLMHTRRRIATLAVTLTLLSFLLRCTVVWCGLWDRYPYLLYSWTPGRLDGLLCGATLAMLVRSRWRQRTLQSAPFVFMTGASVALVSIFAIHLYAPEQNPLVGTGGPLLYAVTFAALLACALPVNSLFARLFSLGVLRFFGRLSYGLYILHWLLHGAIDDDLHGWFATRIPSKLAGTIGPGLVELGLSVALAMLSFRFFEEPILRLKRYYAAERANPRLRASAELRSAEVPGATH